MNFALVAFCGMVVWLPLCLSSQMPPEPALLESYDYIVVGAGSAGSVVANRLAKRKEYTVLLLEAGGEMTDELFIPFMAPFVANENNSWGYHTTPQVNALKSFPGRMGPITQGKVMGGTSSLNSMNYVRGSRHDFDKWENEYGATGWRYDQILYYFKQIENFNITDVFTNETWKYHGRSGETPVNYPKYHTNISDAFLQACAELDYKKVDYNGKYHSGYSRVQSNTADGVRMSASTCFLRNEYVPPLLEKLHISTKSTVTKILFSGTKATGVEYVKNNERKIVNVKREVVVCAGAIGSPKLLMLSGVGPKEQLENHSIPVVADLPYVGQNLQDHVVFVGLVVTTEKDLIGFNFTESMKEYVANHSGLLTIPGAFEALLFTNSDSNKESEDYPDMELELTAVFPGPEIERSPYVSPEIYKKYYAPMLGKFGFMFALAMVQPESRGAVYLNASDPNGPPSINPNLLRNVTDLNRLVKGTMKVMKLFNTKAMETIGAKLWSNHFPGCEKFPIWQEEYVKCFIEHAAFPGQHVCCTCSMGNHYRAVVNERLSVKGGVENVRIVDSSVMPKIVSGNTNAAVMMIAAKGADMILQDSYKWDPQPS